MKKVKITFAKVECEITKDLQSHKPDLEQVVEAFELGNKQLEFRNND